MKKYIIQMSCTENAVMGYAMKIDGENVDCDKLSAEDNLEIQGIIQNVAMKLYHDRFYKVFGECPTKCHMLPQAGSDTEEHS